MRFFFYGTLGAGSSVKAARDAHARLLALGRTGVAGQLYAIPDPHGWFPALLPGTGTVQGWLYEAGPDFGADDLAALDRYEECDLDHPSASLYLRKRIPVMLRDGGSTDAEAYLFNQPLPIGSAMIPDGDFAAWLTGHGFEPFAPPEEKPAR